VHVQEAVRTRESFTLVQRRQGWKGFLRKLISRDKPSRLGKDAREELEIDRSDMNKTIKRHHVKEFENGEWITVHDETLEYPAKRRPS